MHKNLIILAGGASSRMKKPSDDEALSSEETIQANQRSKALIGVGPSGRPLLDYLLYNAKNAGFTHIYIVINEQGGLFKTFYGREQSDNDFHGLSISYAIQYIPEGREKPYGTADAVYQTVTQFPELNEQSYSVCNSDNLYSEEVLRALCVSNAKHAFISYDRASLDFSSERIARFAVAKVNEQNQLVNIIEKPKAEDVDMFKDKEGKIRVSMNIFKFDGKQFYAYLKNCPVHPKRNEKELPTAILNMINDDPGVMIGIPIAAHVPDLTAKEDIAKVKIYLKENYTELDWNSKNEI